MGLDWMGCNWRENNPTNQLFPIGISRDTPVMRLTDSTEIRSICTLLLLLSRSAKDHALKITLSYTLYILQPYPYSSHYLPYNTSYCVLWYATPTPLFPPRNPPYLTRNPLACHSKYPPYRYTLHGTYTVPRQ